MPLLKKKKKRIRLGHAGIVDPREERVERRRRRERGKEREGERDRQTERETDGGRERQKGQTQRQKQQEETETKTRKTFFFNSKVSSPCYQPVNPFRYGGTNQQQVDMKKSSRKPNRIRTV